MTNLNFQKIADTEPWNFKMPFGNYNTKTLGSIFSYDPTYIEWLRDKCNGTVQDAAINLLKAENVRILGGKDWRGK